MKIVEKLCNEYLYQILQGLRVIRLARMPRIYRIEFSSFHKVPRTVHSFFAFVLLTTTNKMQFGSVENVSGWLFQ